MLCVLVRWKEVRVGPCVPLSRTHLGIRGGYQHILSILLLVSMVADTSRQETGRNYWLVSMERAVSSRELHGPAHGFHCTCPPSRSVCWTRWVGQNSVGSRQRMEAVTGEGLPLQVAKGQHPLLN